MGIFGPAGFPMKYTVLKDVDKVLMDHFVRCTERWKKAGCTKESECDSSVSKISVSVSENLVTQK